MRTNGPLACADRLLGDRKRAVAEGKHGEIPSMRDMARAMTVGTDLPPEELLELAAIIAHECVGAAGPRTDTEQVVMGHTLDAIALGYHARALEDGAGGGTELAAVEPEIGVRAMEVGGWALEWEAGAPRWNLIARYMRRREAQAVFITIGHILGEERLTDA